MIYSSLLNLPNANPSPNGEWKVTAPANVELAVGKCVYRYSDIDLAVSGAQGATFPKTLEARQKILAQIWPMLARQQEKLFQVSQLELGRTRGELDLEWKQIETFLSAAISENFSEFASAEARGISVLLGSYVWPIFYAVQFAAMNFLAGNPLILKPSEKSTLTTLAAVEGLRTIPELSSLQVVVGDREVGRRLATHEAVSTVLFQGSFEVGMRVKQDTLSQPSKEVLLYLGAKNPSIVFADAKQNASNEMGIEETLLQDAFWGAGQHCQSISVIFVENTRLKEFTEKFHALSKIFKIGGPRDSNAFMGPLIDGAMLDRYLKFIGISEREGAEIVMRGKPFSAAEKGYFVTPTIALFETLTPEQLKRSVSLQTEVISPHVSIVGFEDEAALCKLLAAMTHGKLATLWTGDSERAKRIAEELTVGEVILNQSAYRKNPWTTVQARKRSGNHAQLGRGLLAQLLLPKSIHS